MTQPNDSAHPVILNTDGPKHKRSPRSRAWMITTFEPSERDLKAPGNVQYDIRCDDTTKPEHGNQWHAHMLIYYPNQVSFNTIKKTFKQAHIETSKNVYDCIGYIKNNVNERKTIYKEEGKEPIDTRFKTVQDLKECNDPNLLDWKQYNTWHKIHENDEIDVEDWHKEVDVFYISGPSGSGKTEKAKEIIRNMKEKHGTKLSLVKYDGNFWHGVNSNGKIAVYDDFRDSHMKASEFINFIDYNTQLMNVKGGTVKNNYKLIIITSIQPLESIYRNMNGEPRKQWERRVQEIKIEEEEEIDVDAL